MRLRRVLACILICGMLSGQTVCAQDTNAETGEVVEEVQKNSGDDENPIIMEDTIEEIKDENISEEMNEAQRKEDAEVAIQKEDTQKEDGETDSEEYTVEESENEQDVDRIKLSICVDYPIIVDTRCGGSVIGEEGEIIAPYTVESENEEICEVTGDIIEGTNNVYFTINGKQKGTTIVDVTISNEIRRRYEVTVNDLPEDAVMFSDIILRSRILDSEDNNIDVNGDGCISKGELAKAKSVVLSTSDWSHRIGSVKDLSGLEHAVNLNTLYLDNNKELSDINVLFKLKNLRSMSLHGTNVSDKDRWKLADFKDFTMIKGEQSVLPTLGPIFEEGLSVETINNKDCIEILRDGSEGSVEILAKEAGETRLHISYNDLSTDITVKVEGISANQEVGEDFSIEIQPRRSTSAKSLYSDEGLILDSNHQLWQLYPKAVKKKDNVKDYVANWVYYGTDHKDAEVRTYLLDNDKKLWKGTEKLAENVERFDGRYALDTQGILHNVYNDGNEKVENVEDWISPSVSDEGIAYLLKTDGTLWKRRERIGSQAPDEWKQIGSNIKQLYDEGYLKKDGTLVSFDGSQTTDIKADFMCETGSFYDKEGNFYFRAVEWNANTGKYDSDYINVGKIDVKQAQKYDKDIYLLNQNKQVYKYNILTNKLELLMSDVLRISETSWAFQTSNGRYYDWECKAMSSARIGYAGYDYDLIWREDGSQMVERNGVPILNNVTLIWRDYLEGSYRTYACRTDGTIWDITEVPKQILDLSVSSYIRGDVNEDGDVNIKDLQIILRGVCEKIELTERQKLIADVVEDGKVDIKDLQKELRFVCGKIEEL